MKTESAAASKGNRSLKLSLPSEGSRARALYNIFKANEGVPIKISASYFEHYHGRLLEDLQDYYGMDIRKIRRGEWVLAGEWFGSKYRDYIAERIAEHDAATKRARQEKSQSRSRA